MGPILYDITSAWPGRVESPEAVGDKFLLTLDLLRKVEPSFRDWESSDEMDGSHAYPIEPLRSRIASWVSAHPPATEDLADWVPGVGHWVYAVSHREPGPGPSQRAEFDVRAGSKFRNENHFEIGSALRPPDLSFVTFPLYEAALLAMIDVWPASWACARCSIWGEDPPALSGEPPFPYSQFQMPWIAYLDAGHAAGVDVPASVTTERTPDGGLLMIASETRLDPTNVAHMRSSRLIAQIMMGHASDP